VRSAELAEYPTTGKLSGEQPTSESCSSDIQASELLPKCSVLGHNVGSNSENKMNDPKFTEAMALFEKTKPAPTLTEY
jgi:hypothetical protein